MTSLFSFLIKGARGLLAVGSFLAFYQRNNNNLLLGKEFASVYILVKIRERGIGLSQKIDEYMESLN